MNLETWCLMRIAEDGYPHVKIMAGHGDTVNSAYRQALMDVLEFHLELAPPELSEEDLALLRDPPLRLDDESYERWLAHLNGATEVWDDDLREPEEWSCPSVPVPPEIEDHVEWDWRTRITVGGIALAALIIGILIGTAL